MVGYQSTFFISSFPILRHNSRRTVLWLALFLKFGTNTYQPTPILQSHRRVVDCVIHDSLHRKISLISAATLPKNVTDFSARVPLHLVSRPGS